MTTTVPVRSTADVCRATPTASPPAELRWSRRPRAVALIAVAGATSGLVWALAMARGPLGAWSGPAFIATGLVLGALAGLVLRQRRVLAVQRRPDLFAAYVGTGQMVSTTETDRLIYDDTLAWAGRTGEDGLVGALQRNGPPPYDDLFKYEALLTHEWVELPQSGHRPHFEQPAAFAEVMRTVLSEATR